MKVIGGLYLVLLLLPFGVAGKDYGFLEGAGVQYTMGTFWVGAEIIQTRSFTTAFWREIKWETQDSELFFGNFALEIS